MDQIEDFLSWMKHNHGRAEATVDRYKRHLEGLQNQLRSSGRNLLDATLADLQEYTGPLAHSRGMSPSSRRPVVAAIRTFYDWAHKRGLVATNPASQLPYPTAGRKIPRAMTLRDADRLLMAPDINTFLGLRDAAIISLLLGCGLRISGLCNLNQSSLITVEHNGAERWVLKVIEKGKKERLVPVPIEAQYLLRAYLAHPDLAAIDRTLPNGDQVLFVSTNNQRIPDHEYHGEARRIAPRTVNDMLQKYGKQVGINKAVLHPHAMRHTFGTELAENDVDLLLRQSLMGHEDPKSTEIYTHLATRKRIEVTDTAGPLGKMKNPLLNSLRELAGKL